MIVSTLAYCLAAYVSINTNCSDLKQSYLASACCDAPSTQLASCPSACALSEMDGNDRDRIRTSIDVMDVSTDNILREQIGFGMMSFQSRLSSLRRSASAYGSKVKLFVLPVLDTQTFRLQVGFGNLHLPSNSTQILNQVAKGKHVLTQMVSFVFADTGEQVGPLFLQTTAKKFFVDNDWHRIPSKIQNVMLSYNSSFGDRMLANPERYLYMEYGGEANYAIVLDLEEGQYEYYLHVYTPSILQGTFENIPIGNGQRMRDDQIGILPGPNGQLVDAVLPWTQSLQFIFNGLKGSLPYTVPALDSSLQDLSSPVFDAVFGKLYDSVKEFRDAFMASGLKVVSHAHNLFYDVPPPPPPLPPSPPPSLESVASSAFPGVPDRNMYHIMSVSSVAGYPNGARTLFTMHFPDNLQEVGKDFAHEYTFNANTGGSLGVRRSNETMFSTVNMVTDPSKMSDILKAVFLIYSRGAINLFLPSSSRWVMVQALSSDNTRTYIVLFDMEQRRLYNVVYPFAFTQRLQADEEIRDSDFPSAVQDVYAPFIASIYSMQTPDAAQIIAATATTLGVLPLVNTGFHDQFLQTASTWEGLGYPTLYGGSSAGLGQAWTEYWSDYGQTFPGPPQVVGPSDPYERLFDSFDDLRVAFQSVESPENIFDISMDIDNLPNGVVKDQVGLGVMSLQQRMDAFQRLAGDDFNVRLIPLPIIDPTTLRPFMGLPIFPVPKNSTSFLATSGRTIVQALEFIYMDNGEPLQHLMITNWPDTWFLDNDWSRIPSKIRTVLLASNSDIQQSMLSHPGKYAYMEYGGVSNYAMLVNLETLTIEAYMYVFPPEGPGGKIPIGNGNRITDEQIGTLDIGYGEMPSIFPIAQGLSVLYTGLKNMLPQSPPVLDLYLADLQKPNFTSVFTTIYSSVKDFKDAFMASGLNMVSYADNLFDGAAR